VSATEEVIEYDDHGLEYLEQETEDSPPLLTRDRPFGILLLITGTVAWLASGWLVLEKLHSLQNPNYITACDVNPWVSCGIVMKTWQASLFGDLPNMFIGIVAFAVIITTGMGLLSGAQYKRWYWIGLQSGVTLGMTMIVWLWSQALYSIGVLCPLCMVVWAMMIPLFIWTTIRNITHGVVKLPQSAVTFLGSWGWIITALVYVGLIASIFFRFLSVFVGSSA
jgi:uncharacterized membrane protein